MKKSTDKAISAWLMEFKNKNKRPPRILHVGNIANNAYLNAKFLRESGIEVDVLSHIDYHLMSYPEWEELLISTSSESRHAFPRFKRGELSGYQRPEWFIQGSLPFCYLCIRAKYQQKKGQYWFFSRLLNLSRMSVLQYYFFTLIGFLYLNNFKMVLYLISKKILGKDNVLFRKIACKLIQRNPHFDEMLEEYKHYFPERKKITIEDFIEYALTISLWQKIASFYDIVQCYATEVIWALVGKITPYVAFEHGTLRDFTMGDLSLHYINSFAYRKANHVFITNGDCLAFSEMLGIQEHSPAIHPIEIEKHRHCYLSGNVFRKKYNTDILLLCPIRHDWAAKGIEVHLQALPLIRKHIDRKVKLLLVEWGLEVERSISLIKKLGCCEDVIWLAPLCRQKLIEFMQMSDVVLDQMALPHFGATAPQTLAVGTPVIMSYKPESTNWIIAEPAPIIAAFTPEEVVKGVLQALEPAWRQQFIKKARDWIDVHHHPDRIVQAHFVIYKKLLGYL